MRFRHGLEIATACLILPCALELFSAARVMSAVASVPRRRGAQAEPAELARYVDALLRRLPWIWRRTCLRRAVTLAALLRRDGRQAEVVIGVRRSAAGELEAHAWLRCDGEEPFLEAGPTDCFMPLRRATHVTP
ncbi:MAG TPA: lasso peptide biosynthesis B2 protein [Gemmatimonadaceae bacterium]|nr:lasso peptide biosynthesis B2 protein [Gemmatimonadaceae bacterium]